ncbi:hypothetical protein KUV89_05885 [Marinobacter hydrocarbonoclasticus]|nr:hypothetical protein [Marinobacter nauticus]
MEWLILAIAAAAAIWWWQFAPRSHPARPLLNAEERQCEQDLRILAGEGVQLHSKVHLSAIMPERFRARRQTLDFLISHRITQKPLVAITLNDNTTLSRLCREANLPLMNARHGVDSARLSALLPANHQADVTPHGHLTDEERDSLFDAIQSLNSEPAK